MASVNKVILIGNLGRDPEIRTFPSGDRVANVTIATTETWKDKQTGERRELTEWHRVVFRGGLAGVVDQYLRKGSQVYVEGSLRTRKYTDSAGVEKSATEIQAKEMTMLGSRQDSAPAPAQAPAARPPAAAPRAPQQRTPAPPPRNDSGFDDMPNDVPWDSDPIPF